jgi:hypothetical protein
MSYAKYLAVVDLAVSSHPFNNAQRRLDMRTTGASHMDYQRHKKVLLMTRNRRPMCLSAPFPHQCTSTSLGFAAPKFAHLTLLSFPKAQSSSLSKSAALSPHLALHFVVARPFQAS